MPAVSGGLLSGLLGLSGRKAVLFTQLHLLAGEPGDHKGCGMTDDRYARLNSIAWWDAEKVRNAVAVVAGAGALGNEVTKDLLLLGWGTIIVVDMDRVERSNLSRSPLFREEDVGRSKAEAIAARAAEINADCSVIGMCGDLRSALTAGMVDRADVLLGCVDNIAARVAMCQLAGRTGTLMIDGALTTWEGTVRTFTSMTDGPCFACGLTQEDLREITLRQSCLAYQEAARFAGGVATTPTVSAVTGALMVQEALKWLHRGSHDQPIQLGKELRMDMANGRFWTNDLPVNEDCPVHWRPVRPVEDWRPSRSTPWRDILAEGRTVRPPAASLQLPVRLLTRWDCPGCAAFEDVVRVHAADGGLACPHCGADVIPRFVNQISGTEPWAGRTPKDMNLAPGTWLTFWSEGTPFVVELDGDLAEFTGAGGERHGDATA
jgi:molybdopterin-synthase adenylyltransferase